MQFLAALQSNIWLLSILMLIPIIGWITFFQSRNPESRNAIFLAFLAGIMSVIPIKAYEKYWDTTIFYFEHLNLFTYIADLVAVPQLSTFLAYLVVNLIVAFGIFLFTAVLMFILEVVSGDNSFAMFKRKFKSIADSPFLFVITGLIIGVVAFGSWITMHQKIWFFLVVGMLEEFTKHLCVRFADEEKIINFDDAISFSIMVALGFSFLENILYMQNFLENNAPNMQQFWRFYILRSSVSVLAHVCFSAIFGYFYGLAHFSHEIVQIERLNHIGTWRSWAHRWLHLKNDVLHHEQMMMEGMLISMGLHALFNSLLEFNQVNYILPLVLGMTFIVLNLFHKQHLHHRRGQTISRATT